MAASCAAFTIRDRRTSGKRRSFHGIEPPLGVLLAQAPNRSGRLLAAEMAQVIVILALLFSIVIAIFAVQNTQAVTVRFLTVSAEDVAVSVLVLIAAALGAVAMLLLGIAREVSLRWRHRAVAAQLKATQARLSQLEAAQASAPTAAPSSAPALPKDQTRPDASATA
jgi:lipopolysaccharide assembly protein A